MSTPFDDERLCAALRGLCTDWDDTPLADEAEPRVPPNCATLRQVASRISEMRALLDELREALAVLPVGAEWNIIGERGYRRDDLLAKIAALKAGQS